MKAGIAWNNRQTETFRTMWDNGATCSQIAAALGTTPNAIAGKRNRMKLPARRYPTVPRGPKPRSPNPPVVLAPPPPPPEPEPEVAMQPPGPILREDEERRPWTAPTVKEATGHCLLWEMTPRQCHWPMNNGGLFLFCGIPTGGRPYCAQHHAKAWKS